MKEMWVLHWHVNYNTLDMFYSILNLVLVFLLLNIDAYGKKICPDFILIILSIIFAKDSIGKEEKTKCMWNTKEQVLEAIFTAHTLLLH